MLVWGKVPSSTNAQAPPDPLVDALASGGVGGRYGQTHRHGHKHAGSPSVRNPSTWSPALVVGEVPGLPPIRYIAAGQQHALLSDGERVWLIGRSLDAAGGEVAAARWDAPMQMLALPGEGVASLAGEGPLP